MGRLELKLLALLVLLTGLPLAVAFKLADNLFERSVEAGQTPGVATALDTAVTLFGDFVRAERGRLVGQIHTVARGTALAEAVTRGPAAIKTALTPTTQDPRIFTIALYSGDTQALSVGSPPQSPEAWRLKALSVPLDLPPYTRLEGVIGLETAHWDRFHQLEETAVHPYNALEADRENIADIYSWSFIGYLALVVLLAAAVAVVVARRVTGRLKRLRDAMEAVAEGDLTVTVPPDGRDEVADLSRGFNDMARQLSENQNRIQYLTQVSVWQGIARKLAHEIKNPLTPIQLAVQQIQGSYKGDDERFAKSLRLTREIVEEEVTTLKRLVDNFSRFARLPAVDPSPGDLGQMVADLVKAHPEIEGLEAIAPAAPVHARFDRTLLRQALTNLIKNAGEAIRDAHVETALITVKVTHAAPWASVEISDNGPGVPEDKREAIFEPYVTGKHDGTGLGLAIVKKIVLDHGGQIHVDSSDSGGARFVVNLPLTAPPSEEKT